jgi:hypothetical protein
MYKVGDNYGHLNFCQLEKKSKKLNKPFENTISENIQLIQLAQLDERIFEEFRKRLREYDSSLEKFILRNAGFGKLLLREQFANCLNVLSRGHQSGFNICRKNL